MDTIELDFTGIETERELHDYFKAVFRLPDYYGRNMDALWDCLYGSFSQPTTLVLRHVAALPEEMRRTARVMLALFADLACEDRHVTLLLEPADDPCP